MKLINVSCKSHPDTFAIVDDDCYDWLNQWKWSAVQSPTNKTPYAVRYVKVKGKQKYVFMHREIAKTPAGLKTDHINGNGLDNRRENLRHCTITENNRNCAKKALGRASSIFKGVDCQKGADYQKDAKRYRARIKLGADQPPICLGRFRYEAEAAAAYDRAAKEHFGEFALLNGVEWYGPAYRRPPGRLKRARAAERARKQASEWPENRFERKP